jgi:hypothetical protein
LDLAVGSVADVEGALLSDDLISIQSPVKKLKNLTPLKMINSMKKLSMEDLYPNIWVFKDVVNHASFCRQW